VKRTSAACALRQLDCWSRDLVFSLCLTEDDLKRLGVWEQPEEGFPSARVWTLARLHRGTHEDDGLAERVADVLDLRFAEEVLEVRASRPCQLFEAVRRAVHEPPAADLPGRVWALLTDERPPVHRLGLVVVREALAAGCDLLARSVARAERAPASPRR